MRSGFLFHFFVIGFNSHMKSESYNLLGLASNSWLSQWCMSRTVHVRAWLSHPWLRTCLAAGLGWHSHQCMSLTVHVRNNLRQITHIVTIAMMIKEVASLQPRYKIDTLKDANVEVEEGKIFHIPLEHAAFFLIVQFC